MQDEYEKTLEDVVSKVGDYPEEAYLFVREGLGFVVNDIHGPETPSQLVVMRFLAKNKLDLNDLRDLSEKGELADSIIEAIDESGGIDKLNRHVGGAQLCWGLRDFALQRWGMLAEVVLVRWHVRATHDFGRIVFAMIENDLMQKQPGDSVDDFKNVYRFKQALTDSYRAELGTKL